jgi:tetratricopeptide (TPR) repeat protein
MSNVKPIQQIVLENKTNSLKNNFKINFNGLNCIKKLGNKKFDKDVASWFKIMLEIKRHVEQLQKDITRKCLSVEYYEDNRKFKEKFIEFAKLMPGDGPIRENYGKALYFLGTEAIKEANVKNADSEEKFKTAIAYFKDAIQVNQGQNDARRLIADLYFDLKNFENAIEYYKEIRKYRLVKKCYNSWIESNNNNPVIREKYSDFLKEIGEYENAKVQLNDAIDIYSDKYEEKKTHEIYKKLQVIDNEMRNSTGSAYSKKLADLCADPKKIYIQL